MKTENRTKNLSLFGIAAQSVGEAFEKDGARVASIKDVVARTAFSESPFDADAYIGGDETLAFDNFQGGPNRLKILKGLDVDVAQAFYGDDFETLSADAQAQVRFAVFQGLKELDTNSIELPG